MVSSQLVTTSADPGSWLRFRCGPVRSAPVLAKASPETRLGGRAAERSDQWSEEGGKAGRLWGSSKHRSSLTRLRNKPDLLARRVSIATCALAIRKAAEQSELAQRASQVEPTRPWHQQITIGDRGKTRCKLGEAERPPASGHEGRATVQRSAEENKTLGDPLRHPKPGNGGAAGDHSFGEKRTLRAARRRSRCRAARSASVTAGSGSPAGRTAPWSSDRRRMDSRMPSCS